jgi:hypothetical protein
MLGLHTCALVLPERNASRPPRTAVPPLLYRPLCPFRVLRSRSKNMHGLFDMLDHHRCVSRVALRTGWQVCGLL